MIIIVAAVVYVRTYNIYTAQRISFLLYNISYNVVVHRVLLLLFLLRDNIFYKTLTPSMQSLSTP